MQTIVSSHSSRLFSFSPSLNASQDSVKKSYECDFLSRSSLGYHGNQMTDCPGRVIQTNDFKNIKIVTSHTGDFIPVELDQQDVI